jgi:hypothetical protein
LLSICSRKVANEHVPERSFALVRPQMAHVRTLSSLFARFLFGGTTNLLLSFYQAVLVVSVPTLVVVDIRSREWVGLCSLF